MSNADTESIIPQNMMLGDSFGADYSYYIIANMFNLFLKLQWYGQLPGV